MKALGKIKHVEIDKQVHTPTNGKATCCLLLDTAKTYSRAEFIRLPYIWTLPHGFRDNVTYTNSPVEALQYKYVFATSPKTLEALEQFGLELRNTKCSYHDLIGAAVYHGDCLVSCLPELEDMYAYGRTMRFIVRRIFDRVLRKNTFAPNIPLNHTIIKRDTQQFYKDELTRSNPIFIAIDLETTEKATYELNGQTYNFGAIITLAGYTFVYADSDEPTGLRYETYTQNFSSTEDYELLKAICAMPQPKVMHNGKYDMHYFTRWRIPVVNYCFDTLYYTKSVSPNIKKKARGKSTKGFYSLQNVSNLYCYVSTYWKDGRGSTGVDYHRYCAMDCHRTALIAQQQLRMASRYAMDNFLMTHWRLPVCIVMGMRGLRILPEKREAKRKQFEKELRQFDASVRRIFGCGANQSKELLPKLQALAALAKKAKLVGAKDLDSTSKNALRDLGDTHPIFERLVSYIKEARQREKWLSTYINKKGFTREAFNGGIGIEGEFFLYDLDPFGTTSRRLASAESAFWIGGNGQNIPESLRDMYGTLPGYYLAASDGSAAETRTTAYLSKCLTMRNAVEGDKDFHSLNAEFFFGIPYEKIYDDANGKVVNKEVRNLGKRINHAANYMMGAGVFVENSGAKVMFKIRELRGLPADMPLKSVAAYMLKKFDERFPEVRSTWAAEQAYEVLQTGCIQCCTGYKPLILESPTQSKSCLNEVVAIESQHFAAQINLNITHALWLKEIETRGNILVLMQIHDENLFAVRDNLVEITPEGKLNGTAELNALYASCAETDYDLNYIWEDGVRAILRIPTDDPLVGSCWADVKS